MPEGKFSQPVSVRTRAGIETVADPARALALMIRGELGEWRFDRPEWAVAFEKLGRAKLSPTPEALADAADAFRKFAVRCGALVETEKPAWPEPSG